MLLSSAKATIRAMSNNSIAKRFSDENKWPFLGRSRDLKHCLAFLKPGDEITIASRLLRVSGESGAGKSFFVKELICQFAQQTPAALALYVNLEESGFESAELEKRLAHLASYPSAPTRKNPQQVPGAASIARHRRPFPWWMKTLQYTYNGVKESTAQIPFVGKVIKAFLPKEMPVSRRRELAAAGRFWDYLVVEARRIPVLLVLDNFQFLPDSAAMEIDSVFAAADAGLRFVTVERLRRGAAASGAWDLRCFPDHRLSVELAPLTHAETSSLVRAVLGENVLNLNEICDVVFRKSGGNPKQMWLQLRALQINLAAAQQSSAAGGAGGSGQALQLVRRTALLQARREVPAGEMALGDYEETITNLPPLDRLSLQIVTLVMGGLKLDDVVNILRSIVHSVSEEDIKKTILDLALVGLLIINGTQNNRVKIEHELVTLSVRRTTTEQETLDLRLDVVSALSRRLEQAPADEEYERLVDRLIGLVMPAELRSRHDLLTHLITLIDKQHLRERFHYLIWLFATPSVRETIDLIPPHCLEAFLDAFQKTSQFDKGLAAIELVRLHGKMPRRELSLYSARYLVQKFEYEKAETILKETSGGSDRDMILFNILLNLCRNNEARRMIESIPADADNLDEFQCVMLRNCSQLYEENEARTRLLKAKRGFSRLGLRFGEATALNNLGVLELWAGKYEKAQYYLNAGRSAFEKLESNEIYQPLTNLAVLSAVRDDATGALQLLDKAKTAVSPWLQMDDLMLAFNQLMLDLQAGKTSGAEAATRAEELHRRSRKIMDMRFRDVLAWFAHQMQTHYGEGSDADSATPFEDEEKYPIPVPPEFDSRIRRGSCSGLEVFKDFELDGRNIALVYVLSPHWRY